MKMIRFALACLLLQFFIPSVCFSQNQQVIDSLVSILQTAKEDSNKATVLLNLSSNLLLSNPEQSMKYAKQAIVLSEKFNLKKCMISAYQNIAGYYYYRADYNNAIQYMKDALSLIEQTHDQHALSDAYSHFSSVISLNNDYSSSFDYINKALKIAETLNDSVRIATIKSNEGGIYMSISDYSAALNSFLYALKISEAIRYNNGIAATNFNIGKIYLLGYHNADKAIEYTRLSLAAATKANNQFQLATTLNQLGEIYKSKEEWNKAMEYYGQSLNINKRIGNFPLIVSNTSSIAFIFSEQGKYSKAIELSMQAIELSKKINNNYSLSAALSNTGAIYMKKKDFKNAIVYLNQALQIAKKIGQKNNESENLLSLAKCYKAAGDSKTAYDYLRAYQVLRDSIINDNIVKKTSEMEAMNNISMKDKEIALLTKDKEIQKLAIKKQEFVRNALIGGLVLMSLLFILFYRYYRTRQLLKLQTLRNKLASDLHDEVGSTLSSISIFSEIARQQSKEVAPLLDQIRENALKIIESMADIVWTTDPENDNFENIIIRMRSFAYELLGTKKINFEFNADESITNMKLSMDTRKNLYLIFKEATNNMVKYAEADKASFSISGSKNNLTMLISDNGRGFEMNQQHKGNGLRNMKRRALQMGAKFLIESAPGKGTTIQLLLKTA